MAHVLSLLLLALAALVAAQAASGAEPEEGMTCDVAIVGAGPGGAYLAARLVESAAEHGYAEVCVFEMLGRPGGRVHSLRGQGPRGDLVVEAGAYRFALNRTCDPVLHPSGNVCIHTPVTTGVIVRQLGLKHRRYDPQARAWDHALAKIVDEDGHDRGYLTFVEGLLELARTAGPGRAAVFFEHELISIERDGAEAEAEAEASAEAEAEASAEASAEAEAEAEPAARPYALRFANGKLARAKRVVLNLPQQPLLRVLANSRGLGDAPLSPSHERGVRPEPSARAQPAGARAEQRGAHSAVLHAVNSFPLLKLYVHYEDAWWRNVLGLTAGPFNNSAAWKLADAGITSVLARQSPAPLQGMYHDADVRCDRPGPAKCRGYIQAAYMGDPAAVRHYGSYRVSRHGDSVLDLDPAVPREAQLLQAVHAALVALHRAGLEAAGELERVSALRPDSGVLSLWDERADGIEAGCHLTQEDSLPGASPRGIPKARVPIEALSPLPHAPGLFVANEAWGVLQCFAEASLQMAENIAHSFFGLGRPSYIPAREYYTEVLYNETAMAQASAHVLPGGDFALRQLGV